MNYVFQSVALRNMIGTIGTFGYSNTPQLRSRTTGTTRSGCFGSINLLIVELSIWLRHESGPRQVFPTDELCTQTK